MPDRVDRPSSSTSTSDSKSNHHSNHPPPLNTNSAIPSSSSQSPLLPPVPQPPLPLASELEPTYEDYQRSRQSFQRPDSQIPEKCLTFCSQRADAPPLCRMLCLRKRRPIQTQIEQLARLRPNRSVPAEETDRRWISSWSPLESLRKKLDPYSFVYVRGTPDGVVGRYMEEMEIDDGQHDFGGLSRNADGLKRRREEDSKFEYLDWGDHGALLHLPLTSIFAPLLSLPQNISRVFTPTYNLLNHYTTSFTDGSQSRALSSFTEEVKRGGGPELLGKSLTYFWKMVEKEEKRILEEKERVMKEKQAKTVERVDGVYRGEVERIRRDGRKEGE